jgi:hypothetical protein
MAKPLTITSEEPGDPLWLAMQSEPPGRNRPFLWRFQLQRPNQRRRESAWSGSKGKALDQISKGISWTVEAGDAVRTPGWSNPFPWPFHMRR